MCTGKSTSQRPLSYEECEPREVHRHSLRTGEGWVSQHPGASHQGGGFRSPEKTRKMKSASERLLHLNLLTMKTATAQRTALHPSYRTRWVSSVFC